jgi:hypothetical protein
VLCICMYNFYFITGAFNNILNSLPVVLCFKFQPSIRKSHTFIEQTKNNKNTIRYPLLWLLCIVCCVLRLYNDTGNMEYGNFVFAMFLRKFSSNTLPSVCISLLLPTLIPLSRVGTPCFYHVVIKILQLFLRPAAWLTSTLLKTGAGANDCKCSRDQRLNVPSETRRSSR